MVDVEANYLWRWRGSALPLPQPTLAPPALFGGRAGLTNLTGSRKFPVGSSQPLCFLADSHYT